MKRILKILCCGIGDTLLFTSPFALFCSGCGLVLCPVFIVLGLILKYIGVDYTGTTERIRREDYWKWLFDKKIKDRKITDYQQLKQIFDHCDNCADFNRMPKPTKQEKEELAKSFGVITQSIQDEVMKKRDRIQVAKYCLMGELAEKYSGVIIREKAHRNRCFKADRFIDRDRMHIKMSKGEIFFNHITVDGRKYEIEKIWNNTSKKERKVAQKFVEEYEAKFLELADNFVENGPQKVLRNGYIRIGEVDINFDVNKDFSNVVLDENAKGGWREDE